MDGSLREQKVMMRSSVVLVAEYKDRTDGNAPFHRLRSSADCSCRLRQEKQKVSRAESVPRVGLYLSLCPTLCPFLSVPRGARSKKQSAAAAAGVAAAAAAVSLLLLLPLKQKTKETIRK